MKKFSLFMFMLSSHEGNKIMFLKVNFSKQDLLLKFYSSIMLRLNFIYPHLLKNDVCSYSAQFLFFYNPFTYCWSFILQHLTNQARDFTI